ncbi:hypothetical protein HanHA300_Chr09g0313071 [Helianthus annuus]|nr:hypothetical protein HanHA300_Chr09g0313071 [Helianthus annuus]KAJ0541913.1 hypothetical protein HanHA89_Chr09g0333971 [Helianthus annuus]KAJ0706981.1 hypothetical protein HanLR1_Chr09g0313351 [Helianthus annuus]
MCYEKSSKRFMVELYRQGNRDVKWTSRWRYAFERNTLKVRNLWFCYIMHKP